MLDQPARHASELILRDQAFAQFVLGLAAGAAVPFFIVWAVVTTSGWSAPAGR